MTPTVVLDTETTSLRHDRRAWEVGMIRGEGDVVMTDHTEHTGRADVQIITIGEDGAVLVRRWSICAGCAARLADHFGEPVVELLADADANAKVREFVSGLPGVTRLEAR